ncbi:hypothetical protein [Proteiniphilum sp. UBA5384]|uniref:hypothetical protein n=1 Tax=Proteiniphilum sp. UBA5384 TaxID=1947279 RepID=UPI0025F15B9D|nr:hypothetical protein [Proteiniphilum sp. UBA5384]
MNINTFKTNMRYFYGIVLLLFAILPYSCGDSNEGIENPVESAFALQMRGTDAETFLQNTSIYMFDNASNFVEKKLNVQKSGTKLTTSVKVGTWNIALLTCDTDILQNTIIPAYGLPMASSPMWETKTTVTSEGEFLSQTPDELRYVMLPDVEIEKDVTKKVSTLLYRNVAKIRVVLKEYGNFDTITESNRSMAYAELLDVPTTLAWNGNLYPNGANPDVSTKPMRERFTFDANGKSDTLNFIVPAHRGDAFTIQDGELKPNPSSTNLSTHKLKLRVSMPLGGAEYYGRSAGGLEIEHVPQPNKIILVNVTFYGKTTLDIKIDVKPWEDWITQDETFP